MLVSNNLESTSFLKRFVLDFFAIRGIILSDNEGLHICSSFSEQQEGEKLIQRGTKLISCLNKANGNLQKIKAYNKLKIVNIYKNDYLIHLALTNHLIITIFLASDTNVQLAREISGQALASFEKLNAQMEHIRRRCV